MSLPRPEEGSATVTIAAPPEEVYDLIADVTRIGEWSPECVRAEWVGGATDAAPGARFHGYNQAGGFEWDVPCEVVAAERGRIFSFRAPVDFEQASTWTYSLEPVEGGTRLTESFHAPLLNVEGSPSNFDGRYEMMVTGCEATLQNIKAAAEG